MPILSRANILRFKEILVTESSGFIEDDLGGYSLDSPSMVPNETGDFLGIIKTVVLVGEVAIDTIDTRNLSFVQFNSLTQQQFDDFVQNGQILYNPNNAQQSKILGWVEIGRTVASFYYETCPGGKRPVSEHYFDINSFAFDNKLLVGEALNVYPSFTAATSGPNTSLTPIGNFDPAWTNNMGIIAPRFQPLSLPDYMKFAMFNGGQIVNGNGEIRNIARHDVLQSNPIRVNALFAFRSQHFDNQFATEISPGKWGSSRGVIEEALRPDSQFAQVRLGSTETYDLDFGMSKGECLQTTTLTPVLVGGGVITTTPTTGGPTPPPTSIGESDIINLYRRPTSATNIQKDLSSGSYNTDLKVFRDFTISPCINFIHDFPISLKQKLNIASNTSIDLAELNDTYLDGNTANPLLELGFGTDAARLKWQMGEAIAGRIPFETSNVPDIGDTLTIPRGTIRKEINPDNGCLELTYIGTPMLDYVGPKIVTPADIEYERGDRPGYDEMDQLDIFVVEAGQVLNTKQWYKDIYKIGGSGLKGPGRTPRGEYDPNQILGIIATESESLYPFYFHATDQLWKNGVAETKSIRLSNRGMSRLIITDYSPRGNANFRNVGLIDALPIILNPDEYVDVQIDYVPVRTGLQPWKGKDDPFPALLSSEYPLPYIKMEFEVWTRVSKLGYVKIQDIKDSPGTGPYRFRRGGGEAGLDRELTRKATPWEIKKRNKTHSILAVDVVKQD